MRHLFPAARKDAVARLEKEMQEPIPEKHASVLQW
jgi:hypothetical protein